jgi:hypothetical protein
MPENRRLHSMKMQDWLGAPASLRDNIAL